MQDQAPSTPRTPTVVQCELRRKLMKSRSSIGLARLRKSNKLPVRDLEESLTAPVTPVTRGQAAAANRTAELSILRNSPMTRSNQRKISKLVAEEKSVNFTPVKQIMPIEDEVLIEPITPKQSINMAPVNTSIASLDLTPSKTVNFTKFSVADELESLNIEDDMDLEEITCDPATRPLAQKTMDMKTMMEDSFDYAQAMPTLRFDKTQTPTVPTPEPLPEDTQANERNEQFRCFLDEVKVFLSTNFGATRKTLPRRATSSQSR